MFDKLIDIFIEFIGLAQIYFFVDQFDRAVVLRCGKYHRTVGPGPHCIMPLGLERSVSVNVVPEPLYIATQSAYTKDDCIAHFQIGLIWRVGTPKKFLVDNEDSEVQVGLISAGHLRNTINNTKWAEIGTDAFLDEAKYLINKKLKRIGANIVRLELTDLASGAADRLWVDGVEICVE